MITHRHYSFESYLHARKKIALVKDKKITYEKSWERLAGFPSEEKMLASVGKYELVYKSTDDGVERHITTFVLEAENGVYEIRYSKSAADRRLWLSVYTDLEQPPPQMQAFAELMKECEVPKLENSVEVNFSYLTPDGPNYYTRDIACPTWPEVSANYPAATEVHNLLTTNSPYNIGKLIFWHGIPGTGKTFCVRSLLREWKDKAHFFYIMDPEAFFSSASYMFETILRDDEEDDITQSPSLTLDKGKFRVLILEDSLDLVLEGSRKTMGPSMSRLLNLTEGIIGQGFQAIVLVTSNEPVSKIDPAFTRPGRCLQLLEFKSFTQDQACQWMLDNLKDSTSKRRAALNEKLGGKKNWTLAELYALVLGREVELEDLKKSVGFSRRDQ